MKRLSKIILAVAAVALSVFLVICSVTEAELDCFEANVEALTDEEIIVGPLCMVCPRSACSSLGEVYEDHIKAD